MSKGVGLIGTKVVFDGKEEYNRAAKEITHNLKMLGSEMSALTAEFGKNDTSVEGLTAKKGLLEKRLAEQTTAAQAAEKALADMRDAGIDPASDAYRKMEQTLADSNTAMAWTKSDIASVTGELENSQGAWSATGGVIAETSEKVASADTDWKAIGETIAGVSKAIAAGMAAVGAAAVAMGGYLYNLTTATAEAGSEINVMSQKFGLSREAYQEWEFVFSQAGVSIGKMGYSMRNLQQQTVAVQNALKDNADAFDELQKQADDGVISVDEFNKSVASLEKDIVGSSKAFKNLGISLDEIVNSDPEEIFIKVLEALHEMPEGAERTNAALNALGRGAAQSMMPLINSADSIDELRQKAHELGIVMSSETVDASVAFGDSMDRLTRTFDGVKNSIGAELLPGFTTITDGLTALISGCDNAADAIVGGVNELVKGITNAIPQVLSLLNTVANTVAEVAPSIINALVDGIVKNIPQLIDAALNIVLSLVDAIIQALPALLEGALQIITTLAKGITQALPTLIPAIVGVIVSIIQTLIESVPLFIEAALELIIGLTKGIVDAIPIIINAIPTLINSLIKAILDSIPLIIRAGVDLLISLVKALPEIIVSIVAAIPEIIHGILTAVVESIPLLIEAGIDLFISLIEALPQIIVEIVKAVPQIILSILDAVIGSIPLLIDAGITLFVSLIEAMPQIILEIVKATPQIVIAIVDTIIDLVPSLISAGKDLIMGLIDGLIGSVGAVVDAVRNVASSILGGIRSFFGINSPSKVFAEIGENLAEGLGVGFENEAKDVEKSMTGAMGKAGVLTASEAIKAVSGGIIANLHYLDEAVISVVDSITEKIAGENQRFLRRGSDIITWLTQGIARRTQHITRQIQDTMRSILRTADSFRWNFVSVGENAVQGIWQGFQNMRGWLEGNVMEMMETLAVMVREILQINSPSRVFAKIGEQMAAGIDVGFTEEMRDVRYSILDAMKGVIPKKPPYPNNGGGSPAAGGGFHYTQIIKTKETNYAAQQREGIKQAKQFARKVGVI
ncbi:MAG: hypothetical protein FWE33_04755 [Defluviitaleaceae bacterium]|nr:hypothetical protein [Defluviitaleaceae bacterium]